jgi:hypothetical protein
VWRRSQEALTLKCAAWSQKKLKRDKTPATSRSSIPETGLAVLILWLQNRYGYDGVGV